MEITEIKQKLTIAQVLDHYGLKADKNKRLCCPFHDDQTPSMQVYAETNTVFCFSSNCKLHGKAIDQIDFILHKENLTKHEAIEKAKTLLNHTTNVREEIPYDKLFKVFQANYKKSEYAQRYLQNRNINAEAAQAGFNATGWPQMKQCVIFPLKDKDDKIVSFYGRSIYNKNEAKHFYSKDRKGLYPRWPISSTKTLILTEAVLDAASIYQQHDLTSHLVTVLACYGTNGFTPDHEQAIKELKQLEEVTLFFDGDEAGREGSRRVSEKLRELKLEIKLNQVETPEGEDANSLLLSHEPGILKHLIENRKPILFSSEKAEAKPLLLTSPSQQLDTSNPHRLIYKTVTANYHIKGGLRNETDSMRISLDIEHPQSQRKSRSKLDLYEDKQVEKIAREAGEKLQLRADLIQLDLEILTDQLEAYREKLHATKVDTNETVITVPAHMESKCKEFLQKPKLITRLNDLIGKAGVTGEEQSRIFLTIIALTYKMHEPLHALIQGSSGSGKTHLLAKISSFIPQEDRKHLPG